MKIRLIKQIVLDEPINRTTYMIYKKDHWYSSFWIFMNLFHSREQAESYFNRVIETKGKDTWDEVLKEWKL